MYLRASVHLCMLCCKETAPDEPFLSGLGTHLGMRGIVSFVWWCCVLLLVASVIRWNHTESWFSQKEKSGKVTSLFTRSSPGRGIVAQEEEPSRQRRGRERGRRADTVLGDSGVVRTSLGGRENEEPGSRGGAVHGGRAVRAATVLSVVRTCLGGRENEEVGRGAVGGGAAVGTGSRGRGPVEGGLDGREDKEVGAGGVGVHFELYRG